VAGQDVTNTLMLLAFCAVGRVLQHVFHQWMDSPSLFWVADVLPAVFVSLIGAVTLVVRNRSFVLVKSGAV
jgi:cell shape-determining protein MreD